MSENLQKGSALLLGRSEPRSLKSFGVSGLLGEDAKIYYENLFSPKHLGRVTDLLTMILRPLGADELRARISLLLTFFEAYRAQLGQPKKGWFGRGADPDKLSDPLIVECGVDSEKVAIGIAFYLSESAQINLDGLDLRVSGKQPPSGPFEALLAILHQSSDRLVLRYHPETRRAEIIALHALPGKVPEDQLRGYYPLRVVIFDQKVLGAPKPKSYVELGDVPYGDLLKAETGEKSLPPSATGAVAVAGGPEAQAEAVVVSGGSPEEALSDVAKLEAAQRKASEAFRAKNQQAKGQGTERGVVEGSGEGSEGDESIRMGGENEDLTDQSLLKVGGGAGKRKGQLKKKKSGGLFKRLLGIGGATGAGSAGDSDDEHVFEADSEREAEQVLRFKGSRASQVQDETEIRISASDLDEGLDDGPAGPEALQGVTSMLLEELEAGSFKKVVDAVRDEAQVEAKDNAGLKAKIFAQGLLKQLMEERGRLNEIAKKFSKTSRQREQEFKTRVQGLEQEVRHAIEEVEKRDRALLKAKESVSAANAAMDKLKTAPGASPEETKMKQKLEMANKMLSHSKMENSGLNDKVEELKAQLTNAQMMARAHSGPSMEEYGQLQAKYEKIYRQAEDFKRHNRQLMEMLNAPQKPGSLAAPNSEDTRKKIEAANKLAAAAKKEADGIRTKFVESQKEEVKLRIEINKLQAELKEARAAGFNPKNGAGGGSGETAA